MRLARFFYRVAASSHSVSYLDAERLRMHSHAGAWEGCRICTVSGRVKTGSHSSMVQVKKCGWPGSFIV